MNTGVFNPLPIHHKAPDSRTWISNQRASVALQQQMSGSGKSVFQTKVSTFTLSAISAALSGEAVTLAPGRFGTESVKVPLACEMLAEWLCPPALVE
jgi:hypothetical protein